MAYSPDAPVFADRYRFEPVGNDWDRGRSGYTHLVYDLRERRLGVIKRAETISKQAVEGLKNEVAALRALKGLGVPEVYDTGEAIYGSKKYFYMVIEYIEGIRVERNLGSLSVSERAEILTQLFGLLTQAHGRGIVNGDVDLKHLFWQRDKKQLVVIDWGNARLNIDPKRKTDFAYDLARSGEIIYSFVAQKGRPPAIGSLALPDNSFLVPGLAPLPIEFRDLCKWAPRTPHDGQSPHTAQELLEASNRWLVAVINAKPHESIPPKRSWIWAIAVSILVVVCTAIIGVGIFDPLSLFSTPTNGVLLEVTLSVSPITSTPIETPSPMVTSNQTLPGPTETSTPIIIPSPLAHTEILSFTNKLLPLSLRKCWVNEIAQPLILKDPEGFYQQNEEVWWNFLVDKERSQEQYVLSDFTPCLGDQSIDAMALNAWVTRLEPNKEFGFFLEYQRGTRREYTIWVDKDKKMYLRIRENNLVIIDEIISVVSLESLQVDGTSFRTYYKFPIQVLLEIDNQGLDILYLREAPYVAVKDFDLTQMVQIKNSALPTLGRIQKIGLIGRGGLTNVFIWPLVFLGK